MVNDILNQGTQQARIEAQETIHLVRDAMGITIYLYSEVKTLRIIPISAIRSHQWACICLSRSNLSSQTTIEGELEMSQTKYLLNESDLPKTWYNINADMPVPPQPYLHPGTKEPVTPDFLSVLFPMELIGQEVSTGSLYRYP